MTNASFVQQIRPQQSLISSDLKCQRIRMKFFFGELLTHFCEVVCHQYCKYLFLSSFSFYMHFLLNCLIHESFGCKTCLRSDWELTQEAENLRMMILYDVILSQKSINVSGCQWSHFP